MTGTSTATTSVAVATAPTAPGSFAAGSPTDTSIPLSWTASTPNNGATIAFYTIYSGTSTSTMPQLATTTSLSYTDTGLTSSTTHYYYATAQDSVGNISASSSITSTTTASSSGSGGTIQTGNGNIWVADQGGNRMEEFSATGTYEGQIGCSGTSACSGGNGNGQFEVPYDSAIDASGNLWVVDGGGGNDRVEEFSATGTLRRPAWLFLGRLPYDFHKRGILHTRCRRRGCRAVTSG